MKYKIDWLEVKNTEWTLVSLTGEDGKKIEEVSINKKSKKGELFPNFDNLASGQEVEGELWQSTAGKWYLFPPKQSKQGQGGAFKTQVIEEAQDTKRRDITHFQGEKEYSIRVSSSMNKAIELAIAEYSVESRVHVGLDKDYLEKAILRWREWIWMNWEVDEFKQYPPFK